MNYGPIYFLFTPEERNKSREHTKKSAGSVRGHDVMCTSFFHQFGTLMTKQWLLAKRNWKPSLVQIMSPIAICLLLFCQFPFSVFQTNVNTKHTLNLVFPE